MRPSTLRELVALNLPIVAPLLRSIGPGSFYSNYHAEVDANGYCKECDQYLWILNRWIRGVLEMPVVHCTYLIRADVLNDLTYEDGTDRPEYVRFSDSARKSGVLQYLDNRQIYGYITFDEGDSHHVAGGIEQARTLLDADLRAHANIEALHRVWLKLVGFPFGVSQPTHYRFKLGEFEVTMILDAGAMLDGPWPIVGEDRPPIEVEQLMRENLLPEKKFQPGFTPMFVNTGKQLILFDTGNGANGFVPRPDGGWLAAQLGPAGFAPEEIDLVVLTHGHPDHIGGLMEGGKPLFPKARYVIGEVEYDFWSAKDRLSAPAEDDEYKSGKLFQVNLVPFASRISFLKPDSEAAPGVRAVEAYGHTPGHLAFHIESQGKRLLFWGDCAHHQVASLARPDWHAFFDMDKEKGAVTRKRIYAMAAAERLLVAGYHMPFPSLGFVEKRDTGYHWLPV